MRYPLATLVLLVSALVLSGCATLLSPATSTPIPSPPAVAQAAPVANPSDPCSILTNEEIKTALGETVVPNPFREPVDTGMLCGYFIANKSLMVAIHPADSTRVKNTVDEWRKQGMVQDVPGLGDAAYFYFLENTPNTNSKAGTLYMLKKDKSLTLSLSDPNLNRAKALDTLSGMAQKAAARLP